MQDRHHLSTEGPRREGDHAAKPIERRVIHNRKSAAAIAELERQNEPPTSIAMTSPLHSWLTIEDIAEELGVSIHSVRKWFAAGSGSGRCPPFIRPGRRILVRRDWFDTWCEKQAASA